MKINQNKQAHRCFLLYCSCGELITGCGEGSVHPLDTAVTKPVRLTRTSGCVQCRTNAQYMAFEKSYKPLVEQVEATIQPKIETGNATLGTGNGGVPIQVRRCPNCSTPINKSNICAVCGRNFQ